MVGVILALVLSHSTMPSASVTCPDEPASCDSAIVGAALLAAQVPAARDFATPAEIDCEDPALDMDVAKDALATACDEVSLDFWYRVSRLPDGESGSLVPLRHQRGSRVTSSCGVPADRGQISVPQTQPLALFAVPTLLPIEAEADWSAEALFLPARALAPPDRPPRV
jgi:hypothetical protein